MQITYGVNSGHLFGALISIYSIWKNTSQPVEVTIYGQDLSDADTRKVHKVRELLKGGVEITLKEFDASRFVEYSEFVKQKEAKNLPSYPAVSLLPLILPQLVDDFCLAIDADTLVVGDLSELLRIDLGNYLLGACADTIQMIMVHRLFDKRLTDILRPKRKRRIREWILNHFVALGYVPSVQNFYFNTGVMVMNCAAIRKTFPFQEYLSMEGLKPFFDFMPEQDRLNQLFQERVQQLPLEWNISPYIPDIIRNFKLRDRQASTLLLNQYKEAAEKTKIWHYWSSPKPWEKRYKLNDSGTRDAFQEYEFIRQEFERLTGLTNAST